RNPDTDRLNLVYNEHVEMVEVPIKPSDRLRARDMLGKYHKLFTEKKEFTGDTPVIINVGEWNEEDEETQKQIDDISNQYPDRPIFIDNVPEED
ncbi:terminase small subunit, partial [Staphylococcus capitis]